MRQYMREAEWRMAKNVLRACSSCVHICTGAPKPNFASEPATRLHPLERVEEQNENLACSHSQLRIIAHDDHLRTFSQCIIMHTDAKGIRKHVMAAGYWHACNILSQAFLKTADACNRPAQYAVKLAAVKEASEKFASQK